MFPDPSIVLRAGENGRMGKLTRLILFGLIGLVITGSAVIPAFVQD